MAVVRSGHITAWLEEDLTSARFVRADVLARSGRAPLTRPGVTARRAVVELVREVGGHPQRALLGGAVQPADDGTTTLRIDVSGDEAFDTAVTLDSPLGNRLLVGLPSEYGEAVAAVFAAQEGSARHILVDRAAHHYVDSSPVAFAGAARLLNYVLEHGQLPESAELRSVVMGEL